MKISIIVATYGRRDWSLRGTEAARAIPPGAHEVINLHQDEATLADVRNLAAAAASGDWLCFVDADDRLDNQYFTAMERALLHLWHGDEPVAGPSHPGFPLPEMLLVPALSFFDDTGCTEAGIPAWDRNIFDVNCAVIGTLVPRTLFAQVGGFNEWAAYEDWELWLRCIIAGAKLVPVSNAIYCARAKDGTGRNDGDHADTYRAIRALHGMTDNDVWLAAKT